MSCHRCEITEYLDDRPMDIYISARNAELYGRLRQLLHDWSGVELDDDLTDVLRARGCSLPALVEQLLTGDFTPREQEDLLLVPLQPGETFSPQALFSARTLTRWMELLRSGDLLQILHHRSLTTWFHPIVAAESGEIFAYECLIRGVREDGSIVPPGQLFESAARTDMLFQLDRLARESSVKSAAVKNIDEQKIFINFLPSAIYTPEDCLRSTVHWAHQLNYDPSRIVFEVVESEKVTNVEHLVRILEYYQRMGFQTALDDVGSGYSSLNLLSRLPVNYIKIDMGLVQGAAESELQRSILRALIDIAHQAGMQVIAEGIETDSECHLLRQMGADYLQGFLFAVPSPDPVRRLSSHVRPSGNTGGNA